MDKLWVHCYTSSGPDGLLDLTSYWNSMQQVPEEREHFMRLITRINATDASEAGWVLGELVDMFLSENGKGIYMKWEIDASA